VYGAAHGFVGPQGAAEQTPLLQVPPLHDVAQVPQLSGSEATFVQEFVPRQ
jgi:hypothetical protein